MKQKLFALLFALFLALPQPAFAVVRQTDTARFTSGLMRVVTAPFQMPLRTLNGTLYGPPILGTLGGALSGTFQTLGNMISGAFDMTAAAAPYAKYALFFV